MEVKKEKDIKKEKIVVTDNISDNQNIENDKPSVETPQEKQKESKKFASGLNGQTKIIIVLVAIIAIMVLIFIIMKRNDNRITITAESTLQKIIEINELSTIYYTYNAVATKYKEKAEEKKENVKYYVAYEGIVKAGINFDEIKIDIDDNQKKISITLPEVEIHEAEVNMGSLDYIFVSNVDEKDRISQEAYQLCQKDLNERIQTEEYLKTSAKENAISAVEGLFQPWIATVDKEYAVEIN